MIDSLVKVVEKLTELAQYRERKRDQHFREVVTALYNDMQTVHTDYLRMFEECDVQLSKGERVSAVAEKLKLERVKHEALRQRVIETSYALTQAQQLERFVSFFSSVSHYFGSSDYRSSYGTRTGWVMERLEQAATESEVEDVVKEIGVDDSRRDVSQLVREVLAAIRGSWKLISREYAKAMTASL